MVGRLGDKLVDRLGADSVFVDVESIPPGVDFADEIERELSTCAVLLAIIGPHWLTASDARGSRGLDDPDDFVVLEIQTALDFGYRHQVPHGELNPADILITASGAVKVKDFGVARSRVVDPDDEVLVDTLFGDGRYVSPEQFGGGRADIGSDVYAAGSLIDVMLQHMKAPPPRPSARRPPISPGLDAVVTKLSG